MHLLKTGPFLVNDSLFYFIFIKEKEQLNINIVITRCLTRFFLCFNKSRFKLVLSDAIKADHGYTMESTAVKNLLEVLSEMSMQEKREFLQFTTGSPRLPIGGK